MGEGRRSALRPALDPAFRDGSNDVSQGRVRETRPVEVTERRRAVGAAVSLAGSLGLTADDAVILHDSNRIVIRVLPCDIVARVSPIGWYSPVREVELARLLATETDAPIAGLDPRVDPVIFERDDFEIGLWTYFEPGPSPELSPDDYSKILERLHGALRQIDMASPTFTDRLAGIQQWLSDGEVVPDLVHEDRDLLVQRLQPSSRLLTDVTERQQLLHGEPHPGNVLNPVEGPVFIDFENCARGPVEYDLAWVPTAVSNRYPGVDREVLDECRGFVLALVAAHRWRHDDQHPSGRRSGIAFLDVLRTGPPWPALDEVAW